MKHLSATFSFFILLGSLLFAPTAKADSPLTSIEFYKAYEDIAIVKMAMESNGQITQPILEFLDNEKNLIDVKMAVINALGWEFEGRQNAQLYFTFVNKNKPYESIDAFILNARPDQRLCYAYLLALDNYFDVTVSATIANGTANTERTASSYTYNIISAIINAQLAMDYDWCQVYSLTNAVRNNKRLQKDFRMAAIPIIFEYMDLYAEECN